MFVFKQWMKKIDQEILGMNFEVKEKSSCYVEDYHSRG
jgi:hypothetical protein